MQGDDRGVPSLRAMSGPRATWWVGQEPWAMPVVVGVDRDGAHHMSLIHDNLHCMMTKTSLESHGPDACSNGRR
jgi:hypothetical protein